MSRRREEPVRTSSVSSQGRLPSDRQGAFAVIKGVLLSSSWMRARYYRLSRDVRSLTMTKRAMLSDLDLKEPRRDLRPLARELTVSPPSSGHPFNRTSIQPSHSLTSPWSAYTYLVTDELNLTVSLAPSLQTDSIPASSIRRIAKELNAIRADPPEGCRVVVNDEDISQFTAWVQGPGGSGPPSVRSGRVWRAGWSPRGELERGVLICFLAGRASDHPSSARMRALAAQ